MKKLILSKTSTIHGGVSRGEYCGSLRAMWSGGGYQGSIPWFMQVFSTNCGSYGYTLW
jgi:hypothetical protein